MTADWAATHVVPGNGLRAWPGPNESMSGGELLGAGLPLVVVGTSGEWSEVQASNGWTGWVKTELLVSVGGAETTPGSAAQAEVAVSEGDPDTVARLDLAAAACEAGLDRFERGEIDLAEFQSIAIDAGVVRTEGLVWILDWEQGEWYRFDGFSLRPLSSLADEAAPP